MTSNADPARSVSPGPRGLTKIVTTRALTGDQTAIIAQSAPGVTVVCPGSRDEMVLVLRGAEVLFCVWGGLSLDAGLIRAAADLRWIHVGSTGVEHILIPEVVESGIVVTNSRTVHAVAVAEHALAILLALAKNMHRYHGNKMQRVWERYAMPLVRGSTAGIIGYGAIGRRVAAMARALGMRVLAVRGRRASADTTASDRVYGPEGLLEVLAASDYVVVCVPLTPATRNLIGRREIEGMKNGACLINVSRGGIVDEDALAGALETGALRGAGFDVFAEEPLPATSRLWGLDSLIITPHVAGSRPDHLVALAEHFAGNLRRWIAGDEMLDVVDKRKGY